MKLTKLSPLLTCVMATQMIMSPVAFAINPLEAINMAGQIINAGQQNIASQQQALANQQLVSQMTQPGRDKYFNTDSLSRIPGLLEYMGRNGLNPATLTCSTLPTTVTEIRLEVCRVGLTNDRGEIPQSQLSEMFSMYKTYGDVSKAYESYSSVSNAEGQGFGVGCMQNALQTLSGFFAYRLNELDKLTTNLEALQNQFREASKSDLNAIEDATAVLDGGSSDLANEVRTRRPDLFDFTKRFSDPACKSMFAGDSFNTMGNGSPGGLNQINKRLKEQFSTNTGKYSGESYIGAHATVVADINKMADKAAQQFTLNFQGISDPNQPGGFSAYLGDLKNAVSSTTGLNSQFSADFFADAQMDYNKQNNQILSDISTLKGELSAIGANPDTALGIANNLNATNFDSEVTRLQNQIRNGCLQRSFGGDAFWAQIKKNIVDPTGSKFANKNDFNVLRERVQDIMTNPSTTPEGKIDLLKQLEASQGNRFVLNMQGSYQKTVVVNGKATIQNVSPSSSSPSTYFSDVVSTCDAQFSTNKLSSTMTGAGAIQKLRDINQKYRTLATNEANTIRNQVRQKLIECGNSVEANNSQAGSCTPDRFNTSRAGFCANAAFTCANNMKSCTTQAQNFVTQIKQERTARVNNYKALVQKNKADVVRIFDTALSKYMQEGEVMRGLFGSGFSSPSGIQRDIQGDGKYLDKFRTATQGSPDGQLMLEDPDKYVEMFKKNITALKTAVQTQQNEILGQGGRGGILAQHVEQTKNNYRTAKAKADELSNQCLQKHDTAIAQMEAQRQQMNQDMIKKMNELGEKRQEFCARYSMLDTNPNGACNGNISALMSAPLAAGDSASVTRFNTICARTNNESNNNRGGQSRSDLCQHAKLENSKVITDKDLRTEINGLCLKYTEANNKCDDNPAPVSSGANATSTCKTANDLEEQIVSAYNVWKDQSGSNNAVQISQTDSAPAVCNGGYNGDRNDGSGTLMGADPLRALANQMGVKAN